MQKRDMDNLNFLLSINAEALKIWYEQASKDDIDYAGELLDRYEQELDRAVVQDNLYIHSTVPTLQ